MGILSIGIGLLAACGGGGSDDGSNATASNGSSVPGTTSTTSTGFGACVAGFAGQRSTVDIGCTSCKDPSNNANAVDGKRDTDASDTLTSASSGNGAANAPLSGTATFTATAQPGMTFPAGEQAGAIVRFPGGTGITETVTFTTSLGGMQQEAFPADSGDTSGATDQILLHKTTKAFDTVKAVFSVTAPDGMDKTVQVYEFCS